MENMTVYDVEEAQKRGWCCAPVLHIGDVAFKFTVDDIGNGKMIYISSFFDDVDILPMESRTRGFRKTDTAIRYIKKELKIFCEKILKEL